MRVTEHGVIVDGEGLIDDGHEGGVSLVAVIETSFHRGEPDVEALEEVGIKCSFLNGEGSNVAWVEIAIGI